jgi:hypothetical protein
MPWMKTLMRMSLLKYRNYLGTSLMGGDSVFSGFTHTSISLIDSGSRFLFIRYALQTTILPLCIIETIKPSPTLKKRHLHDHFRFFLLDNMPSLDASWLAWLNVAPSLKIADRLNDPTEWGME